MNKKELLFVFVFLAVIFGILNGCSGDRKPIRTGDTLASFSALDLDGENFSLSAQKGKPVIVRFFLVNCPYCKADTPIINKFYERYRDKGLRIVYINNNAKNVQGVEKFITDLDVQFPVIYDPDGKIAQKYNIKAQPVALILSPEHKLLAALLGGISEPELNELLGQYF